MAERILIAELDIDVNGVIDEQKELGNKIKELREKLKAARKEGTEYTQENIRAAAELRNLSSQYNSNQRIVQGLVSTQDKQITSMRDARRVRAALTAEWERSAQVNGENDARTQQLGNRLRELNEQINSNSQSVGSYRDNVGNYTNSINEAASALPIFGGGIGRATAFMRRFNLTILASPLGWMLGLLGLVAAALGSLTAHFKSSEEGQADFNEITGAANVLLGNLSDVAADTGKKLLESIESPNKAFAGFQKHLERIVNFFKNTFGQNLIGVIERIGAEFQRLFALVGLGFAKLNDLFIDNTEAVDSAQKNLEEANNKIESSNKKVTDSVVLAYNTVINKIKETKKTLEDFERENLKEIAASIRLAKLKLETDRLERKQLVEKAKIEAQVAELRLKSRLEDEFSAAERVEFLKEANDLQDSLLATDVKIAKNRLRLRQIQNSFSKSTKENLDEEARLEANLFQVQTARYNQTRQIQREQNTIRKQDEAEKRRAADEAVRELKEEIQREKERKENARLADLEDRENRLRLEEDSINKEFELKILDLERRKHAEIEAAKETGASVALINQRYANIEKELNRQKEIDKYKASKTFADNIAGLFEQNTVVGKAAAIATTLINTYLGAQAAFAQTPGGIIIKSAAAAIATATGLKNLANIKKVNTSISSGGGASQSGSGGVSTSSFSIPTPERTTETGVESSSFSNLITSQSTSSLVSQQSSAIKTGMKQALKEQPPVLVIEDFEVVQNRRLDVQEEAAQ